MDYPLPDNGRSAEQPPPPVTAQPMPPPPTGQPMPPPATVHAIPGTAQSTNSTRSALDPIALGAAAVIALGSFLPWGTVSTGFGSISINGMNGDGVVTLFFAAVIAGCVALRRRWAYIVGAVCAALTLLLALWDMANVGTLEGNEFASVQLSVGLPIIAIGAIVAGVRCAKPPSHD